MTSNDKTNRRPSFDEMENLFINNEKLEQLAAFLNRFNPIKVMKMERMEIRHSAILAWLLDPNETHNLGDRFLEAFLGEAFRGFSAPDAPTALDIIQSDLRDAEVRCEWQNIDIFIVSQTNNWAVIIENKFHAKQHKGQLDKYMSKVEAIYQSPGNRLRIAGVFLTLGDEKPEDEDERYAPIGYKAVCEILDRLLSQQQSTLSPEVTTFLNHYLDILKEATGMSENLDEMEKLAKQLYRDHKKALDFVIEHGSSTDFAIAARSLFGEDAEYPKSIEIGDRKYVYGALNNRNASFMPENWFLSLGGEKTVWPGCENWWLGFPLVLYFEVWPGKKSTEGTLKLVAEVGPISDHTSRVKLVEAIKTLKDAKVGFQKSATKEGSRYSRFLKRNTAKVQDIQDAEKIAEKMKELLKEFQPEFDEIAKVLPAYVTTVKDPG
jgi:PD-(D/E)XK nuclease superfamily protein